MGQFLSLASSAFPVQIPQVSSEPGQCTNDAKIKEEAKNIISSEVASKLNERYGPPCRCIGEDEIWSRAVYMNKTDSNSEWNSCRYDGTIPCSSMTVDVENKNKVCGLILGSMKSPKETSSYAFENYLFNGQDTLDKAYVDGVSITYGTNTSRYHVWSYVAPQYRADGNGNYLPLKNCECSNSSYEWPYTVPAFVGTNYFCDSSEKQTETVWTGEDCSHYSSCCMLNQAPWFCIPLPNNTDGNLLEIRRFGDAVDISLIEIFLA